MLFVKTAADFYTQVTYDCTELFLSVTISVNVVILPTKSKYREDLILDIG